MWTRRPTYSPPSPCLRIRIRCRRWWRKTRTSQTKICRPPPDLWGANNATPNDKPPSFFLLFSPLVFVGKGKDGGGASSTKTILVLSPDLATVHLWLVFTSPLEVLDAAPHPHQPSSRLYLKQCVWRSYFNFIYMMIADSIWSTLMRDLTLLIFFFITKYPIRKNVCHGIIYHWINTIKIDKRLESYQFANNQDYQKRKNICKVINSN